MTTEPGGWELKRGLDQLRTDVREDIADLKSDVASVSAKFDAMSQIYVTHREHSGLATRVENIEKAADKRTDRGITIWLAVGIALLSSLTSVGLGVVQMVGR